MTTYTFTSYLHRIRKGSDLFMLYKLVMKFNVNVPSVQFAGWVHSIRHAECSRSSWFWKQIAMNERAEFTNGAREKGCRISLRERRCGSESSLESAANVCVYKISCGNTFACNSLVHSVYLRQIPLDTILSLLYTLTRRHPPGIRDAASRRGARHRLDATFPAHARKTVPNDNISYHSLRPCHGRTTWHLNRSNRENGENAWLWYRWLK